MLGLHGEEIVLAERLLEPLPDISPLCIFAAARPRFDCVVRRPVREADLLDRLFEMLPLPENGWDADTCTASRIGTSRDGFDIWRVERG